MKDSTKSVEQNGTPQFPLFGEERRGEERILGAAVAVNRKKERRKERRSEESIEGYDTIYINTVVSSQSNKIPEALTSAFQLAAPQE